MEPTALEDVVRQEYEKTLVVPDEPQRKQFLLCPVGLVGAGKTTVMKPLAEKLSLVRVSGDEIRKILKDHGSSYEPVSRIGESIIRNFLSQGMSVAIDSDCAGSFKSGIPIWAKEYGATAIWIHINPPEAFIINKLRNFKYDWLFKDADDAIANYTRRKPLHEHLEDIPFTYTFDTSRPDLPAQIEEAAKVIEALTLPPA